VAFAAGVGALLLLVLISISSDSPAPNHSLVEQNFESPRSLHSSSDLRSSSHSYPHSPSHEHRAEAGQPSHHALPSPVGPPPVAPPGNRQSAFESAYTKNHCTKCSAHFDRSHSAIRSISLSNNPNNRGVHCLEYLPMGLRCFFTLTFSVPYSLAPPRSLAPSPSFLARSIPLLALAAEVIGFSLHFLRYRD
jgi:hypothetical protein